MMIHSTIKKAYMPETSPHKNPQKNCAFHIKNMQNKPNLNNSDHQLTACISMSYVKSAAFYVKKTNPIQTQYKPKQTQFQKDPIRCNPFYESELQKWTPPDTKQKQTQFKPNSKGPKPKQQL